MHDKTRALMQRGTAFLGSEYAVLCGAMSWVSERSLVSAISNAGGFGVIACGAMTPELLDAEIAATKALTRKPFGVNLITWHPMLYDLIAVCAQHRVPFVARGAGTGLSGGALPVADGVVISLARLKRPSRPVCRAWPMSIRPLMAALATRREPFATGVAGAPPRRFWSRRASGRIWKFAPACRCSA